MLEMSIASMVTSICLYLLLAAGVHAAWSPLKPIDNSLIDSSAPAKGCSSNTSVDLLLILDGSSSVGDAEFHRQLAFAGHLARRLNISVTGSHMAVAQFSESPQLEIALQQFTLVDQLVFAISRIKYWGGATNTGQALRFAIGTGFQGSRGGSVPKVLVVLTDGQSQDEVAEPAQLLRDAHVLIYAIGITNLVNLQQLHQITGNMLRVFTVDTFYHLDQLLAESLTWSMCRTDFRPGTPDIICAPDRIGVRATTKKPFDGYVFVAEHFHQEECRAGPENFSDPRSIGITVPFNSKCNVRRFMTNVDQMVKVQCFYMEAEKEVTATQEVSMISAQVRQQVYPMPRCEYSLRRDHPNGPVVHYAVVGQRIFHRWECFEAEERDNKNYRDMFGMLVHSCHVDNGHGDRVEVLDGRGCGLDAVLLSTPEYDSHTTRLAIRDYHVFKYADRPVMQFECQVTLCLKMGGGCQGITPPKCPETKLRHLLATYGAAPSASMAQSSNSSRKPRFKARGKLKKARRVRSIYENGDSSSYSIDVFTKPLMILERQFAQDIAKQCPTLLGIPSTASSTWPPIDSPSGNGRSPEWDSVVAKSGGMDTMQRLLAEYSPLVPLLSLAMLLNAMLAMGTLVYWIRRHLGSARHSGK